VKYIVVDDTGDPSRNQALHQQLVEQDHAIAFVAEAAVLTGIASVSYDTAHQIPTIGGGGPEDWFTQSPMYFPSITSGIDTWFAEIAGTATVAPHAKFATINCIESSLCSELYKVAPQAGAQFGLQLVGRYQVSLTQPDFTAICQSASSAGAQIVVTGLDGNSLLRLSRSCNGVNFHPNYMHWAEATSPDQIVNPLMDGAYMYVGGAVPWFLTNTPEMQTYHQVVTYYHAPFGQSTLVGWLDARLFNIAAQNISDPPTSQSILDGLWNIKGNTVFGLTEPLTFNKNQSTRPSLCFSVVQLHPSGATSPTGGKIVCP
jgi:ABC-type branched-subunit amino acid transport system substrate-binding protein